MACPSQDPSQGRPNRAGGTILDLPGLLTSAGRGNKVSERRLQKSLTAVLPTGRSTWARCRNHRSEIAQVLCLFRAAPCLRRERAPVSSPPLAAAPHSEEVLPAPPIPRRPTDQRGSWRSSTSAKVLRKHISTRRRRCTPPTATKRVTLTSGQAFPRPSRTTKLVKLMSRPSRHSYQSFLAVMPAASTK